MKSIKNTNFLLLLAAFGVTAILSNCGSSSSDSDKQPEKNNNHELNVTPSLGKIFNATVKLFESNGTSLLATYEIASDGKILIEYNGDYSGPIVVAVLGDEDATYFDEMANTEIAFGAGESFHAIIPSGTTETAVSLLTEVAYQYATVNNMTLSDSNVLSLNEKVRAALAPELSSIISPPQLFDSTTTSSTFDNNNTGKYALRLAAFAKLGASDGTPALSVLKQLALDFSDGTLDGQSADGAIPDLLYIAANLATDLTNNLIDMANSYGTDALQTALSTYEPISNDLGFLIPSGDGAALADGNGATATIGANTYTYLESVSYLYFPLTGKGVFTAYNEESDALTKWSIAGLTNAVGTYTCGESDDSVAIARSFADYPNSESATECVVEIISISTLEIEGRFSAKINGMTVNDGYFRYESPKSSATGLEDDEFGYTMDVNGENVTNNTVIALDEWDRGNGYINLLDTPYMGIGLIPEGESNSYACGDGPNQFRLVNMSYGLNGNLGSNAYTALNETYPGSCTVDITYADGIYSGTFSGTLYNPTGDEIIITNGFFRNDGRNLL